MSLSFRNYLLSRVKMFFRAASLAGNYYEKYVSELVGRELKKTCFIARRGVHYQETPCDMKARSNLSHSRELLSLLSPLILH